MARVVLKPRKAKPFFGRHPWVLSTAVARVDGALLDGDAADLVTHEGNFVARGLYNSRSRIRMRLFTWDRGEELDELFWRTRLERAVVLRSLLGYDSAAGAARVVFSEGDGLSGLIVDRYGPYVVVQPTSLGMGLRLPMLVPALVQLLAPKGVLVRCDEAMARAEGIELAEGPFWGSPPEGPVEIEEHGLRFAVDLMSGHKTGFYLDQRENRHRAARFFAGRRVLDMFCYTGGFSVHAAAAGAREVLGVDSSRKAVELAEANAARNGLRQARFACGSCFETMESMRDQGETFEGVVLDPPKFARGGRTLDESLRAYHYLNRLGVELLAPGGILVTCSCSGHVSRHDFQQMLLGVAQQTRREIQILEQHGAAPDHPTSATCAESEYLKCFICRVC